MKKALLAILSLLLLLLSGCIGAPGDPLDTMYMRNIYVTSANWDDIRTPVSSIKLPLVNPPTETAYKSSLVLAFEDKAVVGQEQIIYFAIQIPHKWREGTALIPHIHWVGSDASAGDTTWILTYSWANMGAAFPDASSDPKVFANSLTLDYHNTGHFSSILDATKNISSMLLCSLKRNSSNATDTYTGSAYLLEIDFHYQSESLGSIGEENKP